LTNLKYSDELILKNTLLLIKNVLTRLKTNNSIEVLQMWKFPSDIANILLNNDNMGHFETKNFKLRTKLYEIMTLIATYQFGDAEIKNFLQNLINSIYLKGNKLFLTIKIYDKITKISQKYFEKTLEFLTFSWLLNCLKFSLKSGLFINFP